MSLRENLQSETVAHLGPGHTVRVGADSSIAETVRLMKEARRGCAMISEGSELVGVFTERDLLQRVLGPGIDPSQSIRTVMTPDPVTIKTDDWIQTAILRMGENDCRHLPVLDVRDSRPVGILSVKRIVHYLVQHFPRAIYTLPPDPNHSQRVREGA